MTTDGRISQYPVLSLSDFFITLAIICQEMFQLLYLHPIFHTTATEIEDGSHQ